MKELLNIQNGCKSTYEAVYNEWHQKLISFILSKTGSQELAEEVVQQTFVRVWERRDVLSLNHPIASQLFRIARTILIDQLRKNAHARKYINHLQLYPAPIEHGDNTMDYRESLSRIQLIIDEMPPMRKKVFQMSRFEEQSYAEIARNLGISPKTVENHIALALKQLRKLSFLIFLLGVFRV